MGKTYKFTLPQNKEVENTNVRVENGEVLVEVEFKEKFEPKGGDFCVSDTGLIFIVHNTYNVGKQMRAFSYIGESDNNKEIFKNLTYTINNGRFATPEEKSEFLARLEKEYHKRWNEETKQLEDIRWRAKRGSKYYRVTTSGVFEVEECEETCSAISYLDYSCGNYFRTKEAAQKVADQIKEIFKNSKAE